MSTQINAKTPADQRQKIVSSYQQQLQEEKTKVLQPLVDQTDKAIAAVAKSKGLLLVVNAESRVYGGTDVTADVVKALQ
jgi:Skp family chaperone for outer membrane proteins